MNWKNQVTEQFEKIKYLSLGLRGLQPDEQYEIGDIARNSHDWDLENDCSSEDELNGTCTILVNTMWVDTAEELIEEIEDTIESIEDNGYGDGRIVLLGGRNDTQGYDPAERIISNAKVLAIIK